MLDQRRPRSGASRSDVPPPERIAWRPPRTWSTLALLTVITVGGCVHRLQRVAATTDSAATLDRKAPFLKAHLRDGGLLVMTQWPVDDSARLVTGAGTRYDMQRTVTGEGLHAFTLDAVVLLEANVSRPSETIGALSIVSGVSASIAPRHGIERLSASDSLDLGARELVDLVFETPPPAPALATGWPRWNVVRGNRAAGRGCASGAPAFLRRSAACTRATGEGRMGRGRRRDRGAGRAGDAAASQPNRRAS